MIGSEVERLEVFRLAVLADDTEVVRVVGDTLAGAWIGRSRFRDVDDLMARSLEVQTSADTLLWAGWARRVLGDPARSIVLYEQRLGMVREVGDRAGEAATLNNLGGVYAGLGDRVRALVFYNEALPIFREVGDRAGEAVTRYNIAMIHRAEGRFAEAVAELEITVELDRQVQHPDLESDTNMLHQVRDELDELEPR